MSFFLSIFSGTAIADGMHTWMTIDEWGQQTVVFVDRHGYINISCDIYQGHGRNRIVYDYLKIKPPGNIIYISNNSILFDDGSVWILYAEKFSEDFKCTNRQADEKIYLRKVIPGNVKKIVGTPTFVLALTNDGHVLGFGAQDGWGFGVPLDKTLVDGRGEWVWNHESDDSMTPEDFEKLGFMGSAIRGSNGELVVKSFEEIKDEVIDIAANQSLFGVLTKSGRLYIWGQEDRHGLGASVAGQASDGKTRIFEIAHSIAKPQRLFFGRQYLYLFDIENNSWMWGGFDGELYHLINSMGEYNELISVMFTSKKPRKISSGVDLRLFKNISASVPLFELYSPFYYYDLDVLKIGYMFSDNPFYGRWLNDLRSFSRGGIMNYVERMAPLRKFYNQYDGVTVDISALEGRKIKSMDPFPVSYLPQYFSEVYGVVIDEEDNFYEFLAPIEQGDSNSNYFFAGNDYSNKPIYLPYPKLVKIPTRAWPVDVVIQK